MTIDRMVQEKADAYRNNPAALQKNYQMNQDLLDLLALQKIKSEKDAAARELQMSMEQNPQTIAEQRGVEAVDRTKDDLVKQVGGVAAQRQRQQQQNIQRAAAGAPPARQQMTGVAGQPAPNMRMQSGGIVSFANGGDITDAQLAELKERGVNITKEQFAGFSAENQARLLQSIDPEQSGLRRDLFSAGNADAAVRDEARRRAVAGPGLLRRGLAYAFGTAAESNELARQKAAAVADSQNILQTLAARAGPFSASAAQPPVNTASMVAQDMRQPNAMGGQPPAGQPPVPNVVGGATDFNVPPPAGGGISTAFSPIRAPVIPTDSVERGRDITYRGQAVTPGRIADIAGKEQGRYARNLTEENRDSEAERLARQAQADEFQNRSGIAKIRAEQVRQQRDLNERNAASRANNRFYDLLARAGGQGALANIGRASSDMRAADRMQEQVDLANVFAREDVGIKDDLAVSGRSLVSGDKQYELSENARKEAAKNNQQLINNMRTNLTKDAIGFLKADTENLAEDARYRRDLIGVLTSNAGNKLKADIANMQGRLEAEANSIKSMIGRAKNRSSWVEVIDKIELNIASINQKYDELLQDALRDNPVLRRLETKNDAESAEKARQLREQIKNQVRGLANSTLETYNSLKIYSLRQSGVLGNMPAGSGSGSGSGARVIGSRPAPSGP